MQDFQGKIVRGGVVLADVSGAMQTGENSFTEGDFDYPLGAGIVPSADCELILTNGHRAALSILATFGGFGDRRVARFEMNGEWQ